MCKRWGWLVVLVLVFSCSAALALTGGSSIENAVSISLDTYYTDYLSSSSDVNFYKFTTTTAGYLSVSFSHDYVDSSSDYWRLQIIDASQNEFLNYLYRGNILTENTTSNRGLPAGTYYIKVSDYYYSDVNYKFRVNFTPSSVWETEFNNTIPTADSISLGEYYYGTIWQSSDVDYYQFTLTSNGYLTVSFSHQYVDSSSNYWRLRIIDAAQNEYLNYLYRGNILAESTTHERGLPAGTYYVVISDYYYSDVDYKFKINFTSSNAWETEFNNSIPTADDISIGTYYYGNLWQSSDVDYYKFIWPEDQFVIVSFNHDYEDSSSNYWRLEIIDDAQNVYSNDLFKGNIKDEMNTTRVRLTAGTYYLKISDYYWSECKYNFKIRMIDEEGNEITVSTETPTVAPTETPAATATTTTTPTITPAATPAPNPEDEETEPDDLEDSVIINGMVYSLDHDSLTATFDGPEKTTVTTITIPAKITANGKSYKVTAIEDYACENLKKLKSISIGKYVKIIGKYALSGCRKLTKVSGGTGITTIGEGAFQKCTVLTAITLNSSVKKIGKEAFYGCSKLKKIMIKTTKLKTSTVGSNAFKGIHKAATVTCPSGKKSSYKKLFIKRGAPGTAKFK